MKNINIWKPSKYTYINKKLRGSRDPNEVSISSRLICDLVARFYDEKLEKYASGHLLDLGCGKVPLYASYKDYVSKVTCVDWENSYHKNEFLDLSADLNEKLPFDSEQFDTVILSDVMEHIREPRILWEEIFRILKKDGILIMNVPFFYWLHEEPFDYYRYTKHNLVYVSQTVGFELISIESIGGAPEILIDIFSKIVINVSVIGKPLARVFQRFGWFFHNTKFGLKLSNRTSDKFPLEYGLILKK
jgi:SAM-dependent methyltransferase